MKRGLLAAFAFSFSCLVATAAPPSHEGGSQVPLQLPPLIGSAARPDAKDDNELLRRASKAAQEASQVRESNAVELDRFERPRIGGASETAGNQEKNGSQTPGAHSGFLSMRK